MRDEYLATYRHKYIFNSSRNISLVRARYAQGFTSHSRDNYKLKTQTTVIYPPLTTFWVLAKKVYWGTFYFPGWQVKVCAEGFSAISSPATRIPSPEDVSRVTAELIDQLETEIMPSG